MKRLDTSEIIFKVLSYTLVTLFVVATLYPFIYTISIAISGYDAVISGSIVLLPKDIQFAAISDIVNRADFWQAYANTIFMTFYGTIFSMFVSICGAYALSKDKLVGKKTWNFLLVFTMWFTAGMIPSLLNYKALGVDNRWGIVFCLGMNAFNIILLRNYFSGIPHEIEEAAIVDGANEFQVLTKIYIPMSKASIATVTLFYAISRWNGYFWARLLLIDQKDKPLMVFLREEYVGLDDVTTTEYFLDSYIYAMILLSIIPIMIVYPYLQKFFQKGVNVGGVKE